jgi:hypothetical protein
VNLRKQAARGDSCGMLGRAADPAADAVRAQHQRRIA